MLPEVANLYKKFWIFIYPLTGLMIGWKLDRMEDERMSLFRDKSALYRRNPPPSEPSW